jgi:hypothetical protein
MDQAVLVHADVKKTHRRRYAGYHKMRCKPSPKTSNSAACWRL